MVFRCALLVGALALSLGVARADDDAKLEKQLGKLGKKLDRVARAFSDEDEPAMGKRLRLEIGLGLPSVKSGKDFVGKSPMTGGLSYDLGRTGNGTWGLYTGSILRSREAPSNDVGTETRSTGAVGFGVQYRNRPASEGALYFGGGIGTYSVMTSTSIRREDTTSTVTTEKSIFGGKVFVGKDINSRVYIEGAYTKVGGVRLGSAPSRDLSHASLSLGYRF